MKSINAANQWTIQTKMSGDSDSHISPLCALHHPRLPRIHLCHLSRQRLVLLNFLPAILPAASSLLRYKRRMKTSFSLSLPHGGPPRHLYLPHQPHLRGRLRSLVPLPPQLACHHSLMYLYRRTPLRQVSPVRRTGFSKAPSLRNYRRNHSSLAMFFCLHKHNKLPPFP